MSTNDSIRISYFLLANHRNRKWSSPAKRNVTNTSVCNLCLKGVGQILKVCETPLEMDVICKQHPSGSCLLLIVLIEKRRNWNGQSDFSTGCQRNEKQNKRTSTFVVLN